MRELINIPIAHKEGRYVATPEQLRELYENEQIVFKYVDTSGSATSAANPNGSMDNIAGVANLDKNVLAMMPHPERASDPLLGSTDGKALFQSMIDYVTAL